MKQATQRRQDGGMDLAHINRILDDDERDLATDILLACLMFVPLAILVWGV